MAEVNYYFSEARKLGECIFCNTPALGFIVEEIKALKGFPRNVRLPMNVSDMQHSHTLGGILANIGTSQ